MGTSLSPVNGTAGTFPVTTGSGFATATTQEFHSGGTAGTSTTYWDLSSAQSHSGGISARYRTGCEMGEWNWATAPGSTAYFRAYVYLGSNPSNSTGLFAGFDGAFSKSTYVGIGSAGKLFVKAGQSSLNTIYSAGNAWEAASAFSTGQWYRVEAHFTATTTQVKAWTGAKLDTSDTPDFDSGVVTNASSMTYGSFGVGFRSYSSGFLAFAPSSNIYIDDIGATDSTWLGPAIHNRTTFSATVTAATVAASVDSSTLTATVTSPTTTAATVTASASDPTTVNATVTSPTTTAATVAAASSPPGDGYPWTVIDIPDDLVNTDDPADDVRGGPAVLNVSVAELKKVLADLIAARQQGDGYVSIEAALAALHANSGSGVYDAAIQRSNHTGTQTASTISDFNTAVRLNRPEQLATPTAALPLGGQKITGLGTPTASTDAATKAYVDSAAGSVTQTAFDALSAFVTNGGHKVPATMTSPPTVTVGASGAATAVTGSTVTAANSAVFTYLGAVMTNVGTLGSYANCYRQDSTVFTSTSMGQLLCVEFETDSDDFELVVRTEAAWARGRLMVDGEYAAADFTISGTASEYRRIRVQFGSAKSRRVRFEAQGVSFCGVAKHPTDTLWATTRNTGPVVAHVGDSYCLRYLASTVQWAWGGYLYQAGFHLGWDVYPMAIAGTGFQNDNYGAGDPPYASRTTQLLSIPNLAAVVVQASVNDPYYGSFNLSTVQTNVNTWFSTVRAGLTNGEPIYAIGGIVANSATLANQTTIAGYLSTACGTYDGTYIDSLDWITGNGYSGSTTGVGNSDNYVATDGVHFVQAGYDYLTQRCASALSSLFGRRA